MTYTQYVYEAHGATYDINIAFYIVLLLLYIYYTEWQSVCKHVLL